MNYLASHYIKWIHKINSKFDHKLCTRSIQQNKEFVKKNLNKFISIRFCSRVGIVKKVEFQTTLRNINFSWQKNLFKKK